MRWIADGQAVFDLLGESTIDSGGPGTGIRMKIVHNPMSTQSRSTG